jgi:hypothetical protein
MRQGPRQPPAADAVNQENDFRSRSIPSDKRQQRHFAQNQHLPIQYKDARPELQGLHQFLFRSRFRDHMNAPLPELFHMRSSCRLRVRRDYDTNVIHTVPVVLGQWGQIMSVAGPQNNWT